MRCVVAAVMAAIIAGVPFGAAAQQQSSQARNGGLSVHFSDQPLVPVGDVLKTAVTSCQLIWPHNIQARVVRIIPNNQTCSLECDGTTNCLAPSPMPGGYIFNLVEPAPAADCYATCTTSANIAVSVSN